MKPSKCTFFAKSVNFLGMTISQEGISMDPAKVAVINDYQPPQDMKGVHCFLGMVSFYRQFISEFASIAKLLTDLMKKDYMFVWRQWKQIVFDRLKAMFTITSVLAYPN